jgi:hypothetical protein
MSLNNDDIKDINECFVKHDDIDYETSKYIIKYNLEDDFVRYYYTIEPIEMTNNWFIEMYELYAPISKTGCSKITLGVDKEYMYYNENEVATDLFNMKVAGDVVFAFNVDEMTADEIEEELKNIKNYLVRCGMNYKNIRI